MCGIVGCVGKIYHKEEEVFKLLSKLDTIRGEHSTGVCSVTKNIGDWETSKMVGTPFDLFAEKSFTKMMNRTHLMLFGHNRQATRGDISDDNAHPFAHGHIIGCHNGTLNSMWMLKDHQKFNVDSDALYYDMSHSGAKETIKKLNGPFALCWYDAVLHTVNLVRNSERPLYYCYTKDHKTMFWASESWMLHVAMSKFDLERGDIIFLAEGQLLTVDVPVVAGSAVENIQHRQEGVEFYKAPASREETTWEGRWSNYDRNRQNLLSYVSQGKTSSKETEETNKTVININDRRSSASLLGRFLGKVVVFSVVGKGKQGNLTHIKCDVEDEINPPELRIFADFNSRLGIELLNSPKLFRGKVKSITGTGNEAYLLVDHRSIVPVAEEEADEVLSRQSEMDYANSLKGGHYTGFEGKLLTAERYAQLTQCGCALCQAYPNLDGREDLTWFSPTEFFCEKCCELEFAQQYMGAALAAKHK